MIGAILAAGSLILSGISAIQGHKEKNNEKKANDVAARDAFSETSRALARRQEEEALAAAQQVHQISQDATSRRGSLAATAAGNGVEGATVNALDAELLRSEYNARDVVERNLAMTERQIEQSRHAAGSEMIGRINGATGASATATGVNIGGALTAFGYDWLKMKAPKGA